MKRLKVVDFNTWHGLNGTGLLNFGELEPAARRQKRYEVQKQMLKSLEADVLFLQEVNPLLKRSRELAEFLQMDRIVQQDQAGIKIVGLGIPGNLSTGLVILAKPELKLKKISGVKLSGSLGFVSEVASFQTAEFRYALVGEITYGGKPVTLINTHLHHGAGSSEDLSDRLEKLYEQNRQADKLRAVINKDLKYADSRRQEEVRKLSSLIPEKTPSILCGDLNMEPKDALLRGLPLSDVFAKQNALTWNKEKNLENHRLSSHLSLATPVHGLEGLARVLRDYDSRPRRVDYIFMSSHFSSRHQGLVMNQESQGIFPSDHFGLMAELSLDS